MEAQLKTSDGRLTFKLTGVDAKTLFKEIATVQEVFEAETTCGCCHNRNIFFRVRTVDDHDYYEICCRDCYARFCFGQNKKGGGLFPKRRDEDGNFLPNRGWAKYEGNKTKETSVGPLDGDHRNLRRAG